MKEEYTCQNPFSEQKKQALRHYEEVSAASHHWSGFVYAAIKAYQDPSESPSGPAVENILCPQCGKHKRLPIDTITDLCICCLSNSPTPLPATEQPGL